MVLMCALTVLKYVDVNCYANSKINDTMYNKNDVCLSFLNKVMLCTIGYDL